MYYVAAWRPPPSNAGAEGGERRDGPSWWVRLPCWVSFLFCFSLLRGRGAQPPWRAVWTPPFWPCQLCQIRWTIFRIIDYNKIINTVMANY